MLVATIIVSLLVTALACGTGYTTRHTHRGNRGKVVLKTDSAEGSDQSGIEINEDYSWETVTLVITVGVEAGSYRATFVDDVAQRAPPTRSTMSVMCLIVGLSSLVPRPQDDIPQDAVPSPVTAPESPGPEALSVTEAVTSTPIPPTPTPVPTQEPPLTVEPTPVAASDVREAARVAVESFQKARSTAYSTWDTRPYYGVLAGDALESSLKTIEQLRNGDCRYYITDDAEMEFRYEEQATDHIVVIASRSETQRRECAGSSEYVCQAFEGRYVVERVGDRWYITDKSIQNYEGISPFP